MRLLGKDRRHQGDCPERYENGGLGMEVEVLYVGEGFVGRD